MFKIRWLPLQEWGSGRWDEGAGVGGVESFNKCLKGLGQRTGRAQPLFLQHSQQLVRASECALALCAAESELLCV